MKIARSVNIATLSRGHVLSLAVRIEIVLRGKSAIQREANVLPTPSANPKRRSNVLGRFCTGLTAVITRAKSPRIVEAPVVLMISVSPKTLVGMGLVRLAKKTA
tara:strand:+ start:4693 stop:5004 length:312 start_codon:yes stop_codon:yes gene_type:complete